ncbi:MAG TPA: class I SAM-dependent methyltransferase [Ramlibacter sp.]|nr:class I SAM-dependent methyltransferase [Ramlibacter sp.]
MTADFYRAFEDRHRGTREEIAQRHRVYLPFLAALRDLVAPASLVDLGCGRGEWLQLARAEGWEVRGVDADEGMLAACRQAGLDVRKGDALEFLRTLGDASVGVVSAFHVVEHMPFEMLRRVVDEALRVLAPGGLLLLETPNPENLVVGSSAFYMDPTHAKPLPPLLLGFVAEFAGFTRVTTLRLHEGITAGGAVTLIDVLAGVSPDYAIVAQKFGPSSPVLDELFTTRQGVNLNHLASKYQDELDRVLREVRVNSELAREASSRALLEQMDVAARLKALERKVSVGPALAEQATHRIFELQDRIRAMEQSTSWRVTAPVRWAGAQRLAVREQGMGVRLKAAAGASTSAAWHAIESLSLRFPLVRRLVVRAARFAGLGPVLDRARPRPVAAPPAELTPGAQRVQQALQQAMGAADRERKN